MSVRSIRNALAAMAVLLLAAAPAAAFTYLGAVGEGPFTSVVHIQFGDGAHFGWEVAYDEASGLTGLDLLLRLEQAVDDLSLDLQFFGDPSNPANAFVDGIRFGDHSDAGFGGGEDFWHYWTRESFTDPVWETAAFGAGLRPVADLSVDGWRYGSPAAPGAGGSPASAPEPAASALLLSALGAAAIVGRRSRASG